MLRSLVGSEMCIRDRTCTSSTIIAVGAAGNPIAINVNVASNAVPGVTNTCLLYTSDAADELLCVDLGGRRIINKKNS